MENQKCENNKFESNPEIDLLISSLNLEKYGKLISFNEYTEGRVNSNYVFETESGKFFMKKYSKNLVEKITYINEVEVAMSDSGIPAIKAIEVNHELGVAIYPYVEGDRSHEYESEDFKRMGATLADIHSITLGKSVPESLKEHSFNEVFDEDKIETILVYKKELDDKADRDETDEIFLEYIELKITMAEYLDNSEELPPSDVLMHGDFHAGNLIIDHGNREIIGVCDWDKSQYGPRTLEVARAYMIIAFGSGENDDNASLKIGEDFLKGYRSRLSLTDDELRLGMIARLRSYIFNTQLEDSYYRDNNHKMKNFVKNRIRILSMLTRYL